MYLKGIILAAGHGTRLYPLTKALSKVILPIYDKPMMYYPMALLMEAGITEILLILAERDLEIYQNTCGDGSHLGIRITYMIQYKQVGIADAFILGKDFLDGEGGCLILGDNLFYGRGMVDAIKRAKSRQIGATVFGCYVEDPHAFGVVEFDDNGKVLSLEEKPAEPKSNYAIPGLYFYDSKVCDLALTVKPSARGELEITSLNELYLNLGELHVEILDHDTVWMDTGNFDSLLFAAQYVETIQKSQDIYIGCIEEVAYKMGYITKEQLIELAKPALKTDYGKHLMRIVQGKTR